MIALIPARGGSKSLPNKNILDLAGKPMIAYTIEAALSAKSINRVIVSTDSEKIANISKEYGAEIPFMRPKDLAEDHSYSIDTYIYTINKINEQSDTIIDEFVVLLPTSPFRTGKHIDEAIDYFYKTNADSIISIEKLDRPLEWMLEIDKDEILKLKYNQTLLQGNRQYATKLFAPNGAIYILRNSLLIKNRSYYSEKTKGYIMDKISSIDVDEPEDFEIANIIAKHFFNNK
jgi:CMP-N,N'-diacetyllegionaminic acid synthase